MNSCNIKFRFRGFFRLYTTDENGNVTKDTGIFPNLIVNQGLDYIGACPSANVSYGINDFTAECLVGTGNATPAYTDTHLQNAIAVQNDGSGNGCNSNTSYNPGPPAYWQGQRSWQFPAGTATGNIAEIGVGPSTTAGGAITDPVFSRALVVDGSGNPTVIPVLATEALTVTYILQVYFTITDTSYTMSLSGTSYSGIWRMCSVGTVPQLGLSIGQPIVSPSNACTVYNGTIGSITGSPTGSPARVTFGLATPYVTGNYYNSLSASYTINQGNLSGGITAIRWDAGGSGGSFQMSVSPNIPKTNVYNMTLKANVSWARYP